MTFKEIPFLSNVLKEREGVKMFNRLNELLKKEEEPQVCGVCGDERKLLYSPKRLPYDYNGEEKFLTIINAPYHRCETCEENVENITFYGSLRNVLEEEIFFKLNKQEEIPKEVDLFEITT